MKTWSHQTQRNKKLKLFKKIIMIKKKRTMTKLRNKIHKHSHIP